MSDALNFNFTPKTTTPPATKPVVKGDEDVRVANPPMPSEGSSATKPSVTPQGGKPSQAEADAVRNIAMAQVNMAKASAAAAPPRFDMAALMANSPLSSSTMRGLATGDFGKTSAALNNEGIRPGKKLSGGAFDALTEAVALNLANKEDDNGTV